MENSPIVRVTGSKAEYVILLNKQGKGRDKDN